MLIIDAQQLMDEKKSKELKYSLEELILTVSNTFVERLTTRSDQKLQFQLKILFDNGSRFFVNAFNSYNGVVTEYGYTDRLGNFKDCLTLQEALNINKYSKDIEYKLHKYMEATCFSIEGYFTMQDIDKPQAIFHENDVKGRYINRQNGQHYNDIVKIINIKERDLDFER